MGAQSVPQCDDLNQAAKTLVCFKIQRIPAQAGSPDLPGQTWRSPPKL
jgi:hypothetical protein